MKSILIVSASLLLASSFTLAMEGHGDRYRDAVPVEQFSDPKGITLSTHDAQVRTHEGLKSVQELSASERKRYLIGN